MGKLQSNKKRKEKVQNMDELYTQDARKEVSHKTHTVYDSEKPNQTEQKEAYWLTGPGSNGKEAQKICRGS